MGFFLKFASKLTDVGRSVNKLNSSLNNFTNENSSMLRKVMTGKEVLVVDFLKLYDTRTYDIHSKRNDIKFMKELDFKGLYLIKNLSKNKYYLGKGDCVFRKVDRHFRGYGNQGIFADYKRKNKFSVCFMKLEGSGHDDLAFFEKEVRSSLSSTVDNDHYYS